MSRMPEQILAISPPELPLVGNSWLIASALSSSLSLASGSSSGAFDHVDTGSDAVRSSKIRVLH
jgi:hypothetical protein